MGTHSDLSITSVLCKLDLWDVVASRGGFHADIDATPFGQGQKQLLCIARSLLNNGDRKILLLDEFSSSLDKEMEQKVIQLVKTEYKRLTVMAVAHRLDTIMGFNKVIFWTEESWWSTEDHNCYLISKEAHLERYGMST
jgi:ATP-binding cassette subfamily C (CFTR/MRP) protein 1